jgi:hypothetical protein
MKSLKEIRKEVDELVDDANQKIDPVISDLIVGLRAHGIPTFFSCAGHKERGWTYPYVDIYTDDSHISFDDFSETMVQAKSEWVEKNVVILDKLIELLSEFYADRETDYKYVIVPHCSIDLVRIRLKCTGSDLLKNMTGELFEKELKILQKEMGEFGTFLINRYEN